MTRLIKVGITGQGGFMGTHLYNFLGTKLLDIERICFKRNYFEDDFSLQNFVKSCDVIIHLAAVNRGIDQQVIYNTNVSLVHKLLSACEATNSNPKIIFSSSIQEEKNNFYGKSKRDGRQLIEAWSRRHGGSVVSLLIPNVFGPFGKPFYNSFISTFSHQIIKGDEPTVINDSSVNMIYINDLCQVFYDEIVTKEVELIKSFIVPHSSSKKISQILRLLKSFKIQYIDKGQIPKVDIKSFELDLFNTFTSFIPIDYFPVKFKKHSDYRGEFVEIMRTETAGQFSFSTTIPGVTRGNHYHTRKVERFSVISGKASIKLRKIDSDEVIEYIIDGKTPSYVDMQIWHTHNITNIGQSELVTLFWINEPYNPEDADTYFINV
jgi:UDP-2-acetamido-2,6-beta-L-arabino-hexul-4-ose reductase